MAELTSKGRDMMKKSTFAVPAKRSYPIPDLAHARNALARVRAFGSPAEVKMVEKAVAKKFPALAARSSLNIKRYT